MKEYELLIETLNPCGGERHAGKEFLEIEAESPEAYVQANAVFPITDSGKNASATRSSRPATDAAPSSATPLPNKNAPE